MLYSILATSFRCKTEIRAIKYITIGRFQVASVYRRESFFSHSG